MVRYVRLRGTSTLWADLRLMVNSDDRSLKTRAGWLLLARQDSPVKSWVDTELSRSQYRKGYVPDFCFNDRIRDEPAS